MKVLTRAQFEAGMRNGEIEVQYAWGTGSVFNFLGLMVGTDERLFKVTGL